jgi:TrmH family RNA methyltransferase
MKKLAASGEYRREKGEFLCDSPKLLAEALRWNAKVTAVVSTDAVEVEGARCVSVPKDVMSSVSPMKTPQGVLFSCEMPNFSLPDKLEGKRYMVLDGVQDPGNVGTIWRTADAAGFQGLLLGAGCADPLSPKVQRSAMGSGFRLPIMQSGDLPSALNALRQEGWTVIASDLRGNDFYSHPDPGRKFVLVIGSEAHGISDATRQAADLLLKLPMRGGAESLNAAVAAGIMMYELMKK